MKKILGAFLIATLLALALAVPAMAAPLVGTRAMAMGGANTAVVNDATAAFWNPAGMSLHKFAITSTTSVISDLDSIPALFSAVSDVEWNSALTGDFDAFKDDLVNSLAASLGDKPFYASLNSFFGITSKWVGVSALGEAEVRATSDIVFNPITEEPTSGTASLRADIKGTATVTAAAKFDLPLGLKWMAIGVNGKLFYRSFSSATYRPDDAGGLESSTELQTSDGYAGDIGMMLQITDGIRVGAVVKDLFWYISGTREIINFDGSTTPGGEFSSDDPGFVKDPVLANVGVGLFPIKGMTLALDLQGINLSDFKDASFMTANLGFEQVLGPFALRLGGFMTMPYEDELGFSYDAQYTVTGGFGLKLGAFRWDLSGLYDFTNKSAGLTTLLALQW